MIEHVSWKKDSTILEYSGKLWETLGVENDETLLSRGPQRTISASPQRRSGPLGEYLHPRWCRGCCWWSPTMWGWLPNPNPKMVTLWTVYGISFTMVGIICHSTNVKMCMWLCIGMISKQKKTSCAQVPEKEMSGLSSICTLITSCLWFAVRSYSNHSLPLLDQYVRSL